MKQLGAFPVDGMLVHCRVTPSSIIVIIITIIIIIIIIMI